MSSKTLLKQMEIFDKITQHRLSPNQYYVLCSMRDSVSPLITNLHLELRALRSQGWITEEEPPKLTKESLILIEQIEKFFVVGKKKTNIQIMGVDFKEKLKEYNELFPNIRLPSGSAARSAVRNLEERFRWFFESNDYKWETIIQATKVYVSEYQSKNWKFMRNSHYFIKKQEKDGTTVSDLANYCAIIESGGEIDSTPSFEQKVV